MITFDSQEDFEKAVMDILYNRLEVKITVDTVRSSDYYSIDMVPKVEVTLVDSLDGEIISSAEDMAL